MASFIVKDLNPQYGGECYYIGTRKIKDHLGRGCEAADFGEKNNAKRFASRSSAENLANQLNKVAGKKQFIAEEVSIYGQQYGKRKTNGFTGFGTLHEAPSMSGGFHWNEESESGYNGF